MSNSIAVLIFSFFLIAIIISVFVYYVNSEKKRKVNISRQFRAFSETYEVTQKNLRTVPRVVVPENLPVVLTLTDDEFFGFKAYALDLSFTGCAVRPEFPLKKLPLNSIIKNILVVTPINTFAIREMKTIRIDHHIQKRLMAFHILQIDEDQFENLKKFMMYLDEFNKKNKFDNED